MGRIVIWGEPRILDNQSKGCYYLVMLDIATIKEEVEASRKIEVIRRLRDGSDVLNLSGGGLKEVKDIVELIAGQTKTYPASDSSALRSDLASATEQVRKLTAEVDMLRQEQRQTEALISILRSTLDLAKTTLNGLPGGDPYSY